MLFLRGSAFLRKRHSPAFRAGNQALRASAEASPRRTRFSGLSLTDVRSPKGSRRLPTPKPFCEFLYGSRKGKRQHRTRCCRLYMVGSFTRSSSLLPFPTLRQPIKTRKVLRVGCGEGTFLQKSPPRKHRCLSFSIVLISRRCRGSGRCRRG